MIYGIIIVQPTAPTGIYGVVGNIANGHVATTILFYWQVGKATVANLLRQGNSFSRELIVYNAIALSRAQQALFRVGSPVISEDISDEINAFDPCIDAHACFATGLACEPSARTVRALSD